MPLSDKNVAVLVDKEYQELEVWYPYYRLTEAGARVCLVGPRSKEAYPSKLGYPCVAGHAAAECDPQRLAAVVIPGGWAPDYMRRDPSMVKFVQRCVQADIIRAAICHGPWMLCCTDALQGRRATSFHAIEHDLRNAGAEWVDEECVVDGKLITARKPDDLPAFCKAILEALGA